jgi:hypothetical protein
LLAIRNAAACIRVGAKPPYRLRKERKTAGFLRPWSTDGEGASSPDSIGQASAQASLKVKRDLS